MDLMIDQEFADKIPPLTKEEFEQLEINILADGVVINPLIVWNGVIVDGHNRYRILQMHPEIPYQTHEKEFTDRYEAIAWICKNQLGRRNLTPAQRKYLIGKQYEAEKNSEGFRGNQYTENDESGESGLGQNDPNHISERTSARIAKEIGTGERYVRRAEEFAKGLDAAEEVSPGIKQEVFSGTLKATDSDVAAIARASLDDRLELVENLRKPRAAARGQPVKEAADPDLEDDDEEADEDKMMEACVEYDFPEGAVPVMPEARCYTVDDLMMILQCGRRAVYELLKRKEFRYIKMNRVGYRISKKSFDEWLDRQGC